MSCLVVTFCALYFGFLASAVEGGEYCRVDSSSSREYCDYGCCGNSYDDNRRCCGEETDKTGKKKMEGISNIAYKALNKQNNVTVYVGGSIGGSVTFVIVCVCIYCFCCRSNNNGGNDNN